MLSPRDPRHPGIPPQWTANYITYGRSLDKDMKEKIRQNRRRFWLVVVISVIAAAAGAAAGHATQHLF